MFCSLKIKVTYMLANVEAWQQVIAAGCFAVVISCSCQKGLVQISRKKKKSVYNKEQGSILSAGELLCCLGY